MNDMFRPSSCLVEPSPRTSDFLPVAERPSDYLVEVIPGISRSFHASRNSATCLEDETAIDLVDYAYNKSNDKRCSDSVADNAAKLNIQEKEIKKEPIDEWCETTTAANPSVREGSATEDNEVRFHSPTEVAYQPYAAISDTDIEKRASSGSNQSRFTTADAEGTLFSDNISSNDGSISSDSEAIVVSSAKSDEHSTQSKFEYSIVEKRNITPDLSTSSSRTIQSVSRKSREFYSNPVLSYGVDFISPTTPVSLPVPYFPVTVSSEESQPSSCTTVSYTTLSVPRLSSTSLQNISGPYTTSPGSHFRNSPASLMPPTRLPSNLAANVQLSASPRDFSYYTLSQTDTRTFDLPRHCFPSRTNTFENLKAAQKSRNSLQVEKLPVTPLSITPTSKLTVESRLDVSHKEAVSSSFLAPENIQSQPERNLNHNQLSNATKPTSTFFKECPPPPLFRGGLPAKPISTSHSLPNMSSLKPPPLKRSKLSYQRIKNSASVILPPPSHDINKPNLKLRTTFTTNVTSSPERRNHATILERNCLQSSGNLSYGPNNTMTATLNEAANSYDEEESLQICVSDVRSLNPNYSRNDMLSGNSQQEETPSSPCVVSRSLMNFSFENSGGLINQIAPSSTPEIVVPDKEIDLSAVKHVYSQPDVIYEDVKIKIEKEIITIKNEDEADPLTTDELSGCMETDYIEGGLEPAEPAEGFRRRDSVETKGHTCQWKSCQETFCTLTELKNHVISTHLMIPIIPSVENEESGDKQDKGTPPNPGKQSKIFVKDSHVPSQEKSSSYLCRFCRKVFAQEFLYKKHICVTEKGVDYYPLETGESQAEELEEDSDSKEHHSFKYPCPVCNKKFITEWLLTCHVREKHSIVHCVSCNKKIASPNILQHNREKHQHLNFYDCRICFGTHLCHRCTNDTTAAQHESHKSGYCPVAHYRCKWCESLTMSRAELMNHIELRHKEEYRESCSNTCFICKKDMKGSLKLTNHYHNVHYKAGACNACRLVFTSSIRFTKHFSLFHEKEPPYRCFVCGRNFGQFQELEIHLKELHNKVGYTCRQCKWYSCPPSQVMLKEHYAAVHVSVTNATVKQFKPTEYFDLEANNQSRKTHTQVNNDKRKYSPEDKSVRKKQKGYTGTTKYDTSQIPKGFNGYTPKIILHDIRHAIPLCKVCGRIFASADALHFHMEDIHNISKQIGDELLRLDLVVKKALPSHDDRPINVCTMCKQTFETQDDLIMHFNSHHKQQGLYSCKQCRRHFQSVESRDAHMEECHLMWQIEHLNKGTSSKKKPSHRQNSFRNFYKDNILRSFKSKTEKSPAQFASLNNKKQEARLKKVGLIYKDDKSSLTTQDGHIKSKSLNIPMKCHGTRSKGKCFLPSTSINISSVSSNEPERDYVPSERAGSDSKLNGCLSPGEEHLDASTNEGVNFHSNESVRLSPGKEYLKTSTNESACVDSQISGYLSSAKEDLKTSANESANTDSNGSGHLSPLKENLKSTRNERAKLPQVFGYFPPNSEEECNSNGAETCAVEELPTTAHISVQLIQPVASMLQPKNEISESTGESNSCLSGHVLEPSPSKTESSIEEPDLDLSSPHISIARIQDIHQSWLSKPKGKRNKNEKFKEKGKAIEARKNHDVKKSMKLTKMKKRMYKKGQFSVADKPSPEINPNLCQSSKSQSCEEELNLGCFKIKDKEEKSFKEMSVIDIVTDDAIDGNNEEYIEYKSGELQSSKKLTWEERMNLADRNKGEKRPKEVSVIDLITNDDIDGNNEEYIEVKVGGANHNIETWPAIDEKPIKTEPFDGLIEDPPALEMEEESYKNVEKEDISDFTEPPALEIEGESHDNVEEETMKNGTSTSPHISVQLIDEFCGSKSLPSKKLQTKRYQCFWCCQFSSQTLKKLHRHFKKCRAKNNNNIQPRTYFSEYIKHTKKRPGFDGRQQRIEEKMGNLVKGDVIPTKLRRKNRDCKEVEFDDQVRRKKVVGKAVQSPFLGQQEKKEDGGKTKLFRGGQIKKTQTQPKNKHVQEEEFSSRNDRSKHDSKTSPSHSNEKTKDKKNPKATAASHQKNVEAISQKKGSSVTKLSIKKGRFKCLWCANASFRGMKMLLKHIVSCHEKNLGLGAYIAGNVAPYVCLLCNIKSKAYSCVNLLRLQNHVKNYHKRLRDAELLSNSINEEILAS